MGKKVKSKEFEVTIMEKLIRAICIYASNIQDEVIGLEPKSDIRDWDFSILARQTDELSKVIQTIETIRRTQKINFEGK